MERNRTWAVPPTLPSGAVHQRSVHALQLDPPKSREVLRKLADSLTPPANPAQALSFRSAGPDARGLQFDPSKNWAYRACAEMIKQHSKSFYMSARLLPAPKSLGIMALYAFCRTSDDLVDESDAMVDREVARKRSASELDRWADLVTDASHGESPHPVVHAWGDTRTRHVIPDTLPGELLSGVRMDLTVSRYETWDDLWVYCYRVASTVGLMSMYITGAEGLEAVPYAVQLGVALQLTNILRDVGEDAAVGRVYLPAEDMIRFRYSEAELMSGVMNASFIRLMEFEIARARALYEAAWPGIALLPRDSRLGVAAAATFYRGILDKIIGSQYDVFSRRAHLNTREKLRLVPGIWWQARRTARSRPAEHQSNNAYISES